MGSDRLKKAEEILGYRFTDRELLAKSLIHASATEDRVLSNERLEFLGDAILGMVICDYIFSTFSTLLEGEMTKVKSTVVSRKSCAKVAEQLSLAELLDLGKGMASRSSLPPSIGPMPIQESLCICWLQMTLRRPAGKGTVLAVLCG